MRLELFISVAAIVLLAVPAHARILINGFGHVGEWRGAKTLYASPVEKAEALRDKEFLCLRLTRGTYLERRRLYIGHGSTRSHMLHVSSAISESDKNRWSEHLRLRGVGAEPQLDRQPCLQLDSAR